jgi:hypothetical protein
MSEVFDISAYHVTGGTLATYTDLADALTGTNGGVPQSLQKGGMSIKFIQGSVGSSDNKYVQCRYMLEYENTTAGNTAFVNPENWQGVDKKPTPASKNFTESGGVFTQSIELMLNTDKYPHLIEHYLLVYGGNDKGGIFYRPSHHGCIIIPNTNHDISKFTLLNVSAGSTQGIRSIQINYLPKIDTPNATEFLYGDSAFPNNMVVVNNADFIVINILDGDTVSGDLQIRYETRSGKSITELDNWKDSEGYKFDYINTTDNLCTLKNIIHGGYINPQYVLVSNSLYDTTRIILEPNTSYSIWRNGLAGKNRMFDAQHTNIFGDNNTGNYTFTTGNSEYYELCLSFLNSTDYINNVMVVKGSTRPSTFVPWIKIVGTDIYKKIEESVQYYSQSRTDNEKKTARQNIGLGNGNFDSKYLPSDNLVKNEVNFNEMLANLPFVNKAVGLVQVKKGLVLSWAGPNVYSFNTNNSYACTFFAVGSSITKFKLSGLGNIEPLYIYAYDKVPVYHESGMSIIGSISFSADGMTIPAGTKFIGIDFDNSEDLPDFITIENIDIELYKGIKNLASAITKPLELHDNQKDVYVTHLGSSSSAWQCSNIYAEEGICEVPMTCDKQGLAYYLWRNLVFGNPKYRRFDYGKASLVGDYTDKWDDDSDAFFTEVGTFYTSYNSMTQQEGTITKTTKVDGLAPIHFDSADFQKHIPSRYSNAASASVSFTIPAGFSKADFIYCSNILSDTVVITTNRSDGIVKFSDNHDFRGNVEANNKSYNMDFSLIGGTNVDTIGLLGRCLNFLIEDTSVDTVITITKSADTSKYLIYWGAVYWGTAAQPYALLFTNVAVGGYGSGDIENRRDTYINGTHPDCLTYQLTTTNNISQDNPQYSSGVYLANHVTNMETYFGNANLKCFYILQHLTKAQAASDLSVVIDIFSLIRCRLLSLNTLIIADYAFYLYDYWRTYYKDKMTYYNFVSLFSSDNVHLKSDGFNGYKALFEKLI